MKRRSAIRIFETAGAVSFLIFCCWLLKADDFTFHNDVRLVLLDASVENRSGTSVAGLTRNDFSVFENGRPQEISIFDNQDAPVTMGILVDESASMAPLRGQVITAAGYLINESNPADEIFVLNFNDTVKVGLSENVLFSNNIEELRAALDRGAPRGRTALYDAIGDGLRRLEAGKRGRKTLVLITDGGDTASHHTRAQTLDLVERSTATIFTVGLFDQGDFDTNPGLLKQLANISGGEALFPQNGDAVASACRHIAKEIRARYTIGYVPDGNKKLPPLRHIVVRVSATDHGKLTALTRRSYIYDQTPAK